ncbi:SDR family NAD(P)-dependent oxidoreductase [Thiolinea disciformis]|uniref:SDR family NAD(P)-dependent oxidoreductase n=1 Tax=Thiolinea disciformis TaxID=125614 RepID=UPI000362615A|nr:SDR family NAD(P)-dependent oxidoreductase [Thiolinea disciformis]
MTRTIVITGASNGLGAALAYYFAAPHIQLGLMARNKTRLSQVSETCMKKGAITHLGIIDVTDTEAMQIWLNTLDQQHPIDLLIANAGITHSIDHQGKPESLEDVKKLLDINLLGVLNTIHPVLEKMLQRQHGQIALISSLAAYRGMPVTPAYSASKAALKSYGEALRPLLAQHNIKINIICPGFIKSDMSDSFPGKRPFIMNSNQAAQLIAQGLDKNKATIAFPWLLHIGILILSVLPFPIASFFMGLSGYNKAQYPRS